SERLSPMLGADGFSEQHGSGGPFASETETKESPCDKHLRIVLCKPRKEREDGEPSDGDLQSSHASKPVGEPSRQPAADSRHQQRRGREPAGLSSLDAPGRDERRNRKAEHLDVHGVQSPSADAGAERAPLTGR